MKSQPSLANIEEEDLYEPHVVKNKKIIKRCGMHNNRGIKWDQHSLKKESTKSWRNIRTGQTKLQ